MTLTMYQASAPRVVRMLNNLSAILDKAERHCAERNIDPLLLTGARLTPDMLPFTRQVGIACDTGKGAVARLAGVDNPKHEDTEQTFPELKARIAKTLAFIASVEAAQIDGSEDKDVTLKLAGREVSFTGLDYLFGFAQPNFYFHVATAYAILRHNGVELGKSDYLGAP